MKRAFLLIASAALLFAGCRKEQISPEVVADGDLIEVNITAGTADQTKAVIDGDGAAACVTRWIMEVRDGSGEVYAYKTDTKTAGTLQNTFTIKLVRNQKYTFSFWADNGGEYYDASNLEAVKYVDGKSVVAGVDAKDAFSASETLIFSQSMSKTITLYRPFAQLNVITTDLAALRADAISQDAYNAFKPRNFNATIKVPTQFNVLTGAVSAETELILSADEFYGKTPKSYEDAPAQATMFMAYIFASKNEKDIRGINFKFDVDSQTGNNAFDFNDIPFQRNYRTNILGNFLSGDAQWTVNISKDWETPAYDVEYFEASSIEEAQEYIVNNDDQKSKEVNLKDAEVKQTDVQSDGKVHFTLTENSPEDMVNFTLPEIPSTIDCDGWLIDYVGNYPTKNVNVNAPENTVVTINAPNSHVTVSGTHYAQIIASTNENSLIIPQGVIVDNLIVKKGGVEIHGTVKELEVTPESGAKVKFGACEKLKAEVYEEAKDYIKIGYKGEQNGDGSWNIVVDPTVYVVEGMTETMVIPEGITHLVASDELTAARLAAEPWMSEDDARNPFFLDYTVTKVSLPASMTPVSGLFYNTMALKEIEFDGSGNLVFENVPIVNSYYVEKITIKNLPETCQFYDVNDNSKPNQYLINLDTPKSDGPKKIEIFLPAGWIEKDYQYKFNSCCATPIYTYVDGKLIGYSKNAKWYTVTEVNENGVQSIIASEDGNDQTAIIYAAENTVIPQGVTELVADEAMQNDPARTWNLDWPFYQNQTVKSVRLPSSLLVKDGKQTFNGTFEHCNNLESITLEGGNDMLVIFPIIARCKGLKSLKIENLPTSFAFQYGPNDNSAVNPRFIYTEGLTDGTTIKVYLPNGWKNSNYQYKFGAQIENGACPTIEVYEAGTEGNYQLLGKSVNNSWVDPE